MHLGDPAVALGAHYPGLPAETTRRTVETRVDQRPQPLLGRPLWAVLFKRSSPPPDIMRQSAETVGPVPDIVRGALVDCRTRAAVKRTFEQVAEATTVRGVMEGQRWLAIPSGRDAAEFLNDPMGNSGAMCGQGRSVSLLRRLTSGGPE
jgi:hypothetical protein